MHPLLCNIVPWVIHIALLVISRTRIIFDTSMSLTTEASIMLALLKVSLRHVSPQYIILWGSWIITRFSYHNSSMFSMLSNFDSHHLSSPDRFFFPSRLYHIHTKFVRCFHYFSQNSFKSVTHRFQVPHFYFQICSI